jgi:hypothetical protein
MSRLCGISARKKRRVLLFNSSPLPSKNRLRHQSFAVPASALQAAK